jgi:hypothetical protein
MRAGPDSSHPHALATRQITLLKATLRTAIECANLKV